MKRRTVGFIAILTPATLTPLAADPQALAKVSRIRILATGAAERVAYNGCLLHV